MHMCLLIGVILGVIAMAGVGIIAAVHNADVLDASAFLTGQSQVDANTQMINQIVKGLLIYLAVLYAFALLLFFLRKRRGDRVYGIRHGILCLFGLQQFFGGLGAIAIGVFAIMRMGDLVNTSKYLAAVVPFFLAYGAGNALTGLGYWSA